MPRFDRSHLPPAILEFAVVADTHFILDPEAYAIEFDSVRQWPQRAVRALEAVAALETDIVIHLGDLSEEPPGHEHHASSRELACTHLDRCELSPRFVPGNMDIGDKPDPTMFTPPVSEASLAWFHQRFGSSWSSFESAGCHFILLNSQILNGDLPAAAEQARWLEEDLAAHDGERIFLFLHMPPFFVSDQEPDTGFYNSIDEPARSWLTDLFHTFRIEAVFCGHTHFRAFNRVGDTRIHVCPSTTTSRAGFYEAFAVAPPPEQGRNDPDKLGFYLLRVLDEGLRLHFVRTAGRTGPVPAGPGSGEAHDSLSARRAAGSENAHNSIFITRTSHDLPASPLGLHLRTPLSHESPGALAWPGVKRQRVRDDHPFLGALELGARHVRIPESDLGDDPLQSRRLSLLRDEGVSITAQWVWSPRLDWAGELAALNVLPDVAELQMPAAVMPPDEVLAACGRARNAFGGQLSLAPLLPRERVPGRYHPRGRLGFTAQELPRLDAHLLTAGQRVDRAVCCVDADLSSWDAVTQFTAISTEAIGALDLVLPLLPPSSYTAESAWHLVTALAAVAVRTDCHLFLDPYVDLDRTNDLREGLLDRLGNPRPLFHVIRVLNTLLFSADQRWSAAVDADPSSGRLQLTAGSTRLTLLRDAEAGAASAEVFPATLYDLTAGTSCAVDAGSAADFPCGPTALVESELLRNRCGE